MNEDGQKKKTNTNRINEILASLSINQPFVYSGVSLSLSTLRNNEKQLIDKIVVTLDDKRTKICVFVNQNELDIDCLEVKNRLKCNQDILRSDPIIKQFEENCIKYILDNNSNGTTTTKFIENRKFFSEFHEVIDRMPQLSPEVDEYFERLKNMVTNTENVDFDLFDENNNTEDFEKLEQLRQNALDSALVTILPNGVVNVFGADINEKYPNQVELVKELFQILESYEKNENLLSELEKIAVLFKMPKHTKDKFLAYFKVKKENVSPLLGSESSDENDVDVVDEEELKKEEIEIKSLDELLEEMKFIDLHKSITKESLKNDCDEIDKIFENECKDMNRAEIKEWCRNKRKEKPENNDINRSIAIMSRANELATKGRQRLRMTQKLAILIFLKSNDDQGHISQISTGEGKTTIVSIVSAIKVLQGFRAHVITTNPILAAEGVKTRRKFFKIVDISVDHNNPDETYKSGARDCYRCDVVYGCMSSFQFDWLRHTFERLGTMGFGEIDFSNIWLVLDEIDSLLIDQGSNLAKLSGPFPGMECLRYVYINISWQLIKTERRVSEDICKELDDYRNELNESPNKDENQLKYENKIAELSGQYLDRIRKRLIKKKDRFLQRKFVSKHLVKFVEKNLENWIECALNARFTYQNNVEYKIAKRVIEESKEEADKNNKQEKDDKDKDETKRVEEDVIVPIDNQNTGVSLTNTILSNGLHQFLQLKHGLNLTYENLTSCFVSNLGYVRKYKNKISGVTGTLGSEPERKLLGSVFKLSFSVVPTYKRKVFYQFPGKVLEDAKFNNWVALAALGEAKRRFGERRLSRAVLVICDSIKSVEEVSKEIGEEAEKAGLDPAHIIKYTDESEADIVDRVIKPNDIIIATNISGRGTDLKTDESLEEHGGMHVILAFLPCNQRVQDQGMGRTSRQGNRGTGQIFVRISEVQALGLTFSNFDLLDAQNFDKIIAKRDNCESQRLTRIKEKKIGHLEFLDGIFDKFSAEYGRLKEQCRYVELDDEKDNLKRWYALYDLKEKWAFWLEEQGFLGEDSAAMTRSLTVFDVQSQFEAFCSAVNGIQNEEIDHNPFYSICLAHEYLERENNVRNRERAEAELRNAFRLGYDDTGGETCALLYPAHVKLFEVAFENGCQMFERYKRAFEDILTKLPDFNNFISLFKTILELLNNALESLKNDSLDEHKKTLKKKLKEAIKMMTEYLSNIRPDKLLEIGEKIQKLLKDAKEFIENLIKNMSLDYIKIGHEQLEKARMGLEAEKDYLETLMRSSNDEKKPSPIETILSFAQQNVGDESPFLFKHLVSRHICLSVYLENIKSLEEQAKTFTSRRRDDSLLVFDKFGDPILREHATDDERNEEGGLMIGSRVSGYLRKLDSNFEDERKLKEHITQLEVKELERVGIGTIYQLRVVYDVSGEIIDYARGQIVIGIGLFGIAIPFPFLMPICEKLGGMFISEGITDIVMALVNQGYTEFDRKAYVKSKAIAYAIHLVTMGIGAILSSAKFLTKVMNACRSLADKLRRVHGPFRRICQLLAKWLDRFADYLAKLIEKIEFSRKSLEDKQAHLARLKDVRETERFVELEKIYATTKTIVSVGERIGAAIFASTVGTFKNLAISICLDKTVSWCLNAILEDLKTHIEKYVNEKIDERLKELDIGLLNKLKSIDMKKHQEIFKEIFDTSLGEQIKLILKQATLNIVRQSTDWRVKLALLSMETFLSFSDIFECVEKILDRYFNRLEKEVSGKNWKNEDNYKRIIISLKKTTAEIIYNKILSGLGHVIKTAPRIFIERNRKIREQEADRRRAQLIDARGRFINRVNGVLRDKNCVHDATANNLGISNDQLADATGQVASERGASIDDSKRMCEVIGIKTSECESQENIEQALSDHNSDRSIMFFEYPNGDKHAVSCFKRDGQLFVQDGDVITTLAEYQQTNACEAVKFLIYDNVNEENLSTYHVRINIRRIENATSSIDFTGQMGEDLYGARKLPNRLEPKPLERIRHYESTKYTDKLERKDIRITEVRGEKGSLTRVGQDEQNRYVFTEAYITAEHIGTGERKSGKAYREPGLEHGGHDVANVLGGPTDDCNMFPQNASINLGTYKQVENSQREWIESGTNRSVFRQCERYYATSDNTAPQSLTVYLEFRENGVVKQIETYWFPNAPYGIYFLDEYGEFGDVVEILANLRYE